LLCSPRDKQARCNFNIEALAHITEILNAGIGRSVGLYIAGNVRTGVRHRRRDRRGSVSAVLSIERRYRRASERAAVSHSSGQATPLLSDRLHRDSALPGTISSRRLIAATPPPPPPLPLLLLLLPERL